MTFGVLERQDKKESLQDKDTKEETSRIHGLNEESKLTNSFKWQLLPKNKANITKTELPYGEALGTKNNR